MLTAELGRLAKWLRILGFDAAYSREQARGQVILRALREERAIVTRARRFPARAGIRIIVLAAADLRGELREVLKTLKIHPPFAMMFKRCTVCNEVLVPAEKDTVKERVPAHVFQTQDIFYVCAVCRRCYWRGTHWGNVETVLKDIGE